MMKAEEMCFPWLLCIASFLYQTIQGGSIYSTGIIYIMLKDALGASAAQTALIPSLQFAALNGIGPVAGVLVQRYGERTIALLGIALGAGGLVCSSFSTNVYHMYAAFSLANGIGLGMVYIPSLTIIDKYFVKHKNIATGIAVCGIGVGSFVYPPLITMLEEMYGWRGTLLLLGGIHLNGLVVCALFRPKRISVIVRVSKQESKEINGLTISEIQEANGKLLESKEMSQPRETEAKIGDSERGRSLCKTNKWGTSWAPLLRPEFICVLFHTLTYMFSYSLVYTHLGAYTLYIGHDGDSVVQIYFAAGVTTTICRVLSGFIAQIPCVNTVALAAIGTGLSGVVTLLFPLVKSLPWVFMYTVAFASLLSPTMGLCMPIVAACLPQSVVPAGLGLVCLICVPSILAGAPLAAWVYEITKIYSTSFYMAGPIYIISGLLLIPALPNYGRARLCKKPSTSGTKA